MQNDFFNELGVLALGSRLKRLSDLMMSDAQAIYQALDHDFQPRWFTLIALLSKKGSIGIVEASEHLGLSQPAISQFTRDLIKKEYVLKLSDEQDSRKKLLSLTPKGKKLVKDMQPMWQAVEGAAKEICDEVGPTFFESLMTFEKCLREKSLKSRALERV
jgi:DNA-binding MarR family transcriptional regulator